MILSRFRPAVSSPAVRAPHLEKRLFTVELDKEASELLGQAARYWSLDGDGSFFLDRKGQIVPRNATIRDIVLPPQRPGWDFIVKICLLR